jgi:hypothetical protein
MGSAVPVAEAEVDVELRVKVWQSKGSDGDPTDEGPYTVSIVSDPDGRGGNEASIWDTFTVQSNREYRATIPVVAGEYFYLTVTEQHGKDNLAGDGADEDDDGKRDDPNDSAWTAPVWFKRASGPRPTTGNYVWSSSSDLYHDPDCFVVQRIGVANRRTGAAPAGHAKHDCKPPRP